MTKQPDPDLLAAAEALWRCRRCRWTGTRHEAANRYGIIECPLCLGQAWVGLLDPVPAKEHTDAAKT